MVRPPWRHGEPGGNDLAAGVTLPAVTTRTVLRLSCSLALVKLNHMRETPHTAVRYSSVYDRQSKLGGQGDNPQGRLQQWRTLRDFTFRRILRS